MSNNILTNLLKKQQATFVPIDKKIYKLAVSKYPNEVIPTHLIIPPSRANILFSQDTKKFKTVNKKFRVSKTSLPEYWSNFDPNTSKYAAYITKPQNQQKCGSCFAFASATSINDVFIFGKKLKFNPNLSPLSILSCIKDENANAQCDGGNPIEILNHISDEGLTTNFCMNYEKFCNNNTGCYTPVKKAFDEKTKIFREANVSVSVPSCGCCPNCNNNFSYYISIPTLISLNTTPNIEGHPDAVEIIKQHLLEYGSAVGGYVVYSNFVHDDTNGKFEKTKGIYIESEKYSNDKDNKNTKEFMGCHAVSIVGWGVEKTPITLDDGTILKNTPYWIVRNSWSTSWGLNGYFKIAMYQDLGNRKINETTAFERVNEIILESKRFYMGGVILFTPQDIKPYRNDRKKCSENAPCDEISPFSKYQPTPIPPKYTSPPTYPTQQKNEINYILYAIYGMSILIFILFIINKLRK